MKRYLLLPCLLSAFSPLSAQEDSSPSSPLNNGFFNPFYAPMNDQPESDPETIYVDADSSTSPSCRKSPHPMRMTLRHIEGKGIGYSRGYSSLDLFFAQRCGKDNNWVPFLDLRGHIFDDGKPAANGGFGFRYISSVVFGLNAYYDYRKTHRTHYNQVGGGLELLGSIFDFRINGFTPVGKKRSHYWDPSFYAFKGNHMILSEKFEFAFKGGNAEIGAHARLRECFNFYAAVGSYYLNNYGKSTWGGNARAALDLSEYLKLEGFASYDHLFKWIFQGQLSINIPFGGRKKVFPKSGRSCAKQYALAKRAVQRVDRFEIIAVDKKKKKTVAIDPATGMPYTFWFVDNTSSSNGTFESPFNTLANAQNASSPTDIIYVFPGDGTTKGMDGGIALKDYQKLLGSGLDYQLPTQLGLITVPSQEAGAPSITNATTASQVILASSGNEIAGFNIISNGIIGVYALGSNGFNLHNNRLFLSNNCAGLRLEGVGDEILASQNNFLYLDSSSSFGINIVSFGNISGGTNYLITQNLFNTLQPGFNDTGIEIGQGTGNMQGGISIGDIGSLTIANNAFVNLGLSGISGKPIGGSGFQGNANVTINQNLFLNDQSGANNELVVINARGTGNVLLNFTNNLFEGTILPGTTRSLQAQLLSSTASLCANVNGNISDSTGTAYQFTNSGSGNFTVDLGSNTGTISTSGTVTFGPCN